ncbi:triple tyrosine motif-containing protein [Metabacillus sp. HB246100]
MKKKLGKILFLLAMFVGINFFLTDDLKASAEPIIVLDPGHGGSDPGAVSGSYKEKDLNLNLAKKIGEYLKPLTNKVYFTRTIDSYLTLEARANYANKLNANMFLSIHHDSSTSSTAKGISTHYSSYRANLDTSDVYVEYKSRKYPYVDERDSYLYYATSTGTKSVHINYATAYDPTPSTAAKNSKTLSINIAKALMGVGFEPMYTSNGARDHNLYVTRHTNMISTLIEGGFMSNPSELKVITNPFNVDRSARAIANEVIEMYGGLKVSMDSLNFSKASPQKAYSTTTLSAKGSGGSSLRYAFHLYDGKEWREVQPYSQNNNFTWVPEKPGNYKFSVHVKDSNSSAKYDDYKTSEFVVTAADVDIRKITTDKISPQDIGESIKLTADAIGGYDLLYAFHLYDGKEWTEVQPYTTNNTYTWKPSEPGNYKYSVHVKDKSSDAKYDDYHTLDYSMKIGKVDVTGIQTNKQSPQNYGQIIQLSAIAKGGYKLQYAFHMYDGKEWKEVQAYSPNNVLSWTPTKPGYYKFSVHVKDQASTAIYDDYYAIDYRINAGTINFSQIQVDKLSPQNIGQTINLTSVATGGYDLQYAYHLYDGKEWKAVRPYSSDKSFTWTPEKAGKYKFSVHVKSSTSGKVYDTYKTLDYEIKQIEPVKAQLLTADKPSPQVVGSSINLSASATGGSQRLYKFHVHDGKEWTVLRDYQVSNSIQWQPPKAGEYKLVVHVKDQGSGKEYDSYKAIMYTMKEVPVDIQSVDVNYTSPQAADTTINLTAKATGGVTKEYKYNVYDGKEWKVLKDYSTEPTVQWTPATAGKYKFSVHVKDANSTSAYDDYYVFYYDVVNKVSISKLTYPAGTPAVNKPIEISASTTGGRKSLYRFWVEENGEWKIIQDYSTTSKVTWTPKEAKTYKFSVHVKDHHSTKEYNAYKGFSMTFK